eukprot:gnl/TRDRNA2_/TRDRNA2_43639_c0_seq2.p1 gnl/TRDRNA2_/TRDRNA2_43639_c0~~gnl/TRDRNA2_/TRDRNA2_43639_c0_seq2.p1  ORF type:complete len:400 (+),score=62.01 gnl/TRDRNA2_/TRDRNA2_43639_c0_seq2:35-1234(+)
MLAYILLAGCAIAINVHASDPCDKTGLDVMLEETTIKERMKMKESMPAAGPNTVLLVIDAQRGFTTNNRDDDVGGFAQVCLVKQNKHHLDTLNSIGAEIEEVKAAGGLIIATKDYHPLDHCSFIGQTACLNAAESAKKYASKAKMTGSYEYEINRYENSFPPHCVGTNDGKTHEGSVPSDWTSTGEPVDKMFKAHPLRDKPPVESGTDLHEIVSDAMLGYERSFIAYKGFSRDFESFGAFPLKGETANQDLVGAKLWLDSTGKHPRPYEKFINPTAEAFNTYISKGVGFKALEAYLSEQSISDVRVVGYVWDFCVKETAIGAVQAGFVDTSVLTYATRPAADGISVDGVPGVPDSGRRSEPLLGSTAVSRNAFSQLIGNDVQVVMKSGSTSSVPGGTEL